MVDKVVELFKNSGHDNFIEASLAVSLGNPKDISSLIPNLKDLNIQDYTGTTLLMVAAAYDHASVCRVLLKHGAKADIKNNEGLTALDIAKTEGSENSAEIISQWLPSLKCEENNTEMMPAENVISIQRNRPKM